MNNEKNLILFKLKIELFDIRVVDDVIFKTVDDFVFIKLDIDMRVVNNFIMKINIDNCILIIMFKVFDIDIRVVLFVENFILLIN